MKLILDGVYVTDDDTEIVCYDESEKFYYCAPFERIEDGAIEINVKDTIIYSKDSDSTYPVSHLMMNFSKEEC